MKYQILICLLILLAAIADCRLKKRRMKTRESYKNLGYGHEEILSPDFNIFEFIEDPKIGRENVLGTIAYKILKKERVLVHGLNEANIQKFLEKATNMYNSDLYPAFYHSAIHAADFIQTLYIWLNFGKIKDDYQLDHNEKMALYLAAIGHDLKHPGYANQFQADLVEDALKKKKIENPKDYYTVLEQMHAKELMKLIHDEKIMTEKSEERVFPLIKRLIEDTDFSKQKDHENALERKDITRIEALSNIFHACDISNFAKRFDIAYEWGKRVTMEFLLEYDVAVNDMRFKEGPYSFKKPTNTLANRQVGWGSFIIKYFTLIEKVFPHLAEEPIALIKTAKKNKGIFEDIAKGKSQEVKDISDADLLLDCKQKRDNGDKVELGISRPFRR